MTEEDIPLERGVMRENHDTMSLVGKELTLVSLLSVPREGYQNGLW